MYREAEYIPVMSTTLASSSSVSSSTVVASHSPREQEEARVAVLASLESAGSNYDHQFQRRAADLHANATAIAKQEAAVQAQTSILARESAKLQKELDKATKGLNEIGDVQNWAETIERDLLVLEETLRLINGQDEQETASGGSTWKLPRCS